MSNAMPPCPIINNDIVCEHGSIKQCSTKSARARRRVMDKQAWKVLKRLYPDSIQLEANTHGCLICAAEAEMAKKAEQERNEEEKSTRKKPLECPLVRAFYKRGSKGYPLNRCKLTGATAAASLKPSAAVGRCPLQPGVYCALPRAWCHRWRKYIKTGEGKPLPAPDASELLCEAHNLPLIPPHLESFLRGETSALLGGNTNTVIAEADESAVASMPIVGAAPRNNYARETHREVSDAATLQALRAAGLSETELHAQRVAMAGLERDMRRANIHGIHEIRPRSNSLGQEEQQQQQRTSVVTNEQLDRENHVVVEILTDEEVTALEKWWPGCHGGTFALRFAIVENSCGGSDSIVGSPTDILWSTVPCRECDPSSRSSTDFVVRNRLQKRGYR